jgi:large subunit ribosomal protein L15
MRLNNLSPNKGAKHRRKRLGKGESSGLGKTAGRGNKGHKARSGGGVRPGFEGGQMPLARRLPKKGFNNAQFKTRYAIVNVGDLQEKFEGGVVDESSLRTAGLVSGAWDGVKILGDGELSRKLTVQVDKVSATAREKIVAAGGEVVEIKKPAPVAKLPRKAKKQA